MPKRITTSTRSIGGRIRYLMDRRKIKQTELAAKIGVTQAAISNLVTDASRSPSASTLLSIARALRSNPPWILRCEGDPDHRMEMVDPNEARLLGIWRSMESDQQKRVFAVMTSAGVHIDE